MALRNDSGSSRSGIRKTKKHHFLRYTLLILAFLLVGGTCYGFYQYHQLNPGNHFRNLKTVGAAKATDPLKKYKQKAGTFNMLLIGSDARKGDVLSHTDSMLLIHADLNKHTYNILSIPRDTRVPLQGYGYTKLTSVQYVSQANHGAKQGIIDAVSSISSLTGVPINYYAETNYSGLQYMVDAIGGIDMKLPFSVTLTHPWYHEDKGKVFSAGTHSLNGKMVAELTHERDSLPGTDYGRQQLQQAALIGIAQKMMTPSNVTKFPALSQSLSKFLVATNMTTDDMISIGLGVKSDFHPQQQIKYRQVQGKVVTMYDDALQANNSEVVLDPGQLQSVVKSYFTN